MKNTDTKSNMPKFPLMVACEICGHPSHCGGPTYMNVTDHLIDGGETRSIKVCNMCRCRCCSKSEKSQKGVISMAKKGGKSKGFISQGIHSNVSRSVLKAMRRDYLASGERMSNQRSAWAMGKNVVLTLENPNKNQTNKKFIRVNARDIWGPPNRR